MLIILLTHFLGHEINKKRTIKTIKRAQRKANELQQH